MSNKLRQATPIRNCQRTYANYRDYKPNLVIDFKGRCGYTDCPDYWFGGKNNFHIDHFKPWKKYPGQTPDLKTDYNNLVYCCSYVNILKSDDVAEYIDPCDQKYDQAFFRDRSGNICPDASNPVAIYMHKKLKLYLLRYQLIWKLEQIKGRIELLRSILCDPKLDEDKFTKVKSLIADLAIEYFDYEKYLIGQL